MMNRARQYFLASLFFAFTGQAATWGPIPSEVWAIKEDPAKGIKDAVILEDRHIFLGPYLERIRRIRVLSESGKKAVTMDAFSETCYNINGRTIYPDGKELIFDKRQDFKEETLEIGEFSQKRKIVIPPGITSNCVVELQWLESLKEFEYGRPALPGRIGFTAQLRFGSAYQTLKETVEIPRPFLWSYLALSGRTQELMSQIQGNFRVFSVTNLPAQELPPFALSVSLDRPVVSIFNQPASLSSHFEGTDKGYWDAVGNKIWKAEFESGIQKGRFYDNLREWLFSGTTGRTPCDLASVLITALEKEVVNLSHLTHEESAKRAKDEKIPSPKDLGEISRNRAANGWGMILLCYHLLKDAGLHPKVAFLADRDVHLFRPNVHDPWQATHLMLVVEDPEKGARLFDPAQRFGAPGLIHPNFQGVEGLLLDPNSDWSGQPFQVPIQPAVFNQKRYEYNLDLGAEEDRFNLNAQFSGFPELAERRQFDVDEQKERDRKLKERFEKRLRGTTILRAEVQNASNPADNLKWLVEARREAEEGRQRYVQPFPGLAYPLIMPDSMPQERILPIVMPYLQVQLARSTFKVPKGYRANLGQPTQQKNSIGSVTWVAELKKLGEENQIVVVMKVTVDSMFAPPTAYEELKTYLNWITDAFKRTVILEKV